MQRSIFIKEITHLFAKMQAELPYGVPINTAIARPLISREQLEPYLDILNKTLSQVLGKSEEINASDIDNISTTFIKQLNNLVKQNIILPYASTTANNIFQNYLDSLEDKLKIEEKKAASSSKKEIMKEFSELQKAIRDEKTTVEDLQKMINGCLKNKEFNINQLSEEGFSLLHYAAMYKNARFAKVLLDHGANILVESKPHRYTVLDLNIREGLGYYKDHACARFFAEEISKLKKAKRVDTKVLDECLTTERHSGFLLIDFALFSADYDIAGLLISLGSPLPHNLHIDVLHRLLNCIVLKGDMEVLRKIAASVPPGVLKSIIDRPNVDGNTLLHCAIQSRNPDVCSALISLGANVNVRSNGVSPLNHAFGQLYIDNGEVATSFLAMGPLTHIIPTLINNGADLRETVINYGSLLCCLIKLVRLANLSAITNPEARELWILMHQVILNAHRYDIPNLYAREKSKKDLLDLFGHQVSLEGMHVGIVGEEIVRSYENFSETPAVQIELNKILNEIYGTQHKNFLDEASLKEGRNINMLVSIALSNLGQTPTIKEMTDAIINTGQVTIVPILTATKTPGVGDHTMTYLFYDHLCARVNCGATVRPPEGTGGITISRVGNLPELIKALPHFTNSQQKCIYDGYLMDTFRRTCDFTDVFKITLDVQTVGNCSWKSSEALVRAIIFMYIYKALFENTRDVDISLNRAEQYSALWFQLFLQQDRIYALNQIMNISLPHLSSLAKTPSTRIIDLIPPIIRQRIIEGNEKEGKALETKKLNYTKEKEKREAVNAFEVSPKDLQEFIRLHLNDPNYSNAILILSFGLIVGDDGLSPEERHKRAMEHLSSLSRTIGANSVEITKEHLYRFEFRDAEFRKVFSDEITRIQGSPRTRPR